MLYNMFCLVWICNIFQYFYDVIPYANQAWKYLKFDKMLLVFTEKEIGVSSKKDINNIYIEWFFNINHLYIEYKVRREKWNHIVS